GRGDEDGGGTVLRVRIDVEDEVREAAARFAREVESRDREAAGEVRERRRGPDRRDLPPVFLPVEEQKGFPNLSEYRVVYGLLVLVNESERGLLLRGRLGPRRRADADEVAPLSEPFGVPSRAFSPLAFVFHFQWIGRQLR